MLNIKYCVIGSGAGGGVLAHELSLESGSTVICLSAGETPKQESFDNELSPEQKGTFDIKPDMTFPAKADVNLAHPLFAEPDDLSIRPRDYDVFNQYQVRHVNGLQNLWGAVCLRYSEQDLENKKSYNNSCRWEVSYKELAQHYDAVEKIARVNGNADGLADFPEGDLHPPAPYRDIDEIFIKSNKKNWGPELFYFANRKAVDLREDSPNRCTMCGNCSTGCRAGSVYKFSTHLLPTLKNQENFQLMENTRCVRLQKSDAPGNPTIVHAIEETTGTAIQIQADVVILAAGALESARILLNSFSAATAGMDQVGKYLQDVPSVAIGTSFMKAWFKSIAEHRGYGDHVLIGGKTNTDEEEFSFVGQLWSNFMKAPLYQSDIQFLPRPLRKIIAKQLYRSTAALLMWGPAVPTKSNSVELSDTLDKFGVPQLKVSYETQTSELRFNAALEKLGLKLLRNAGGFVASPMPNPPGKGIHYTGTCRMGKSPEMGVVDKDLKFFGADNIYVCDGGVIPQLSEKHPTLTIMALAHRLAHHLVKN